MPYMDSVSTRTESHQYIKKTYKLLYKQCSKKYLVYMISVWEPKEGKSTLAFFSKTGYRVALAQNLSQQTVS